MTTRANVTSVDAVKSFRSSLIVYTSKARPTLEEVTSDVIRMRVWLETEQRVYWEGEARRRLRRLEEAKQAYFSARLSLLRGEPSAAERMAVTRAQNALDEAEGKLRIIKKWNKEFDTRTEPLVRQLEKMHTLLSHDMPRALAFLTKVLETLDAYAGMVAPAAPTLGPETTSAPPESSDAGASGSAPTGDNAKAGGGT